MAFVFLLNLRSHKYTLAVAATRSCAVETAYCIYSGVSLDCRVLPYPTFTARERKKNYARLDNSAMRSIYQHVNACVRSVHAVSLPGYLCHAFASEGVRQRERKRTFSAETASQSRGTSVVKLLWRNLRPTLRLYKGVTSQI